MVSAFQTDAFQTDEGQTVPCSPLLDFDVRDTAFAGGAPLNGIDDDQPAIQAAVDYVKTLGGRYDGGQAKVRIPHGQARIESTIDVTGADGVLIEGDGDGSTTIFGTGNFPVVQGTDTVAQPLFRFGVRDLTIYGPGASEVNADGIDLGANNNCYISVRVFACRRAIALENSWQTTLDNIRVDGLGGLRSYDGIYLKDGDASVIENAVLIRAGTVHGVQRYGLRGESVTGSKVFGLELVGCDGGGAYFESPTGKDLKWFSWVGGLVDTCPNLVTIKRGSSSVAELMHFSGMWLGYAYAGNGVGLDMEGVSNCAFSADIISNVQYAANLQDCEHSSFEAKVIKDYDRGKTTSVAVIMNGSDNCSVQGGVWQKAAGSPSSAAIVEQNGASGNVYRVDKSDPISLLPGSGSVVK